MFDRHSEKICQNYNISLKLSRDHIFNECPHFIIRGKKF